MDGLCLELNEKTGIFPLKNGIDFLSFHTYLTESGKVVQKLRREKVEDIRAVRDMMEQQKDMHIPSSPVPRCPRCGCPVSGTGCGLPYAGRFGMLLRFSRCRDTMQKIRPEGCGLS